MSDLFSIENLFSLAFVAFWVLSRIRGMAKMREANTSPDAKGGAASPTVVARPESRLPIALAQSSAALLLRQPTRALDALEAQRKTLQDRQRILTERAADRGPREAVVSAVLTTTIAPELDQLGQEIMRARDAGILAAALPLDPFRSRLALLDTQLRVLSVALALPPHIDAVMSDAEAIAEATMAPLQQFADLHEVDLARHRPICLPAGLVGGEAAWIGLLGMGVPLIFVPDDFDEDLYRWPSIAHEVAHVVLRGVPGLLDEMGRAAGWTDHPSLLRAERGRIVGSPLQAWSAWREEIFADAFTVLMLGPAALLGFEAVFARPDNPVEVLQAHAQGGRYAPHPPAHTSFL